MKNCQIAEWIFIFLCISEKYRIFASGQKLVRKMEQTEHSLTAAQNQHSQSTGGMTTAGDTSDSAPYHRDRPVGLYL